MQRDLNLFKLCRDGRATIGSWLGAAAARLPGSTLVSRNEAQIGHDISKGLRQPHRSLVLQGGQPDIGDGPVNLFDALDDEEAWGAGRPVVIGASVAEGLHPVLADAVADLVMQHSRRRRVRMQRGPRLAVPGAISPAARHLSSWIIDRIADIGASDAGIRDSTVEIGELQYFVASSGARAFALSKTLDAVRPDRSFPEIVDISAGIGLISWLLANEEPRGVRSATVVEPNARYRRAAVDLWRHRDPRLGDGAVRIVPSTAHEYRIDREVDLALICQILCNTPPEARGSVLQRCWEAVKPGGLLAINEIILDDDAPDDEAVRRAYRHSPRRGETIGLLSRFGAPQLFRAHSDWSRPEDPLTMAARDYGSDSFLVVRKAPA